MGAARPRTRANPKAGRPRRDKRRDAPFGLLAVLHPVADRVPEERWNVVLAIGEIRLWIYRDEPNALAEDVVMVQAAVHDRIRASFNLPHHPTRALHPLTPL